MAKKAPAKKTQPPKDSEEVSGGAGPENDVGQVDPWEALASLQVGDVVAVTRTWPSGRGAGHLGHIDIDPQRVEELPDLIKEQFGGGRYLLRWKKRGPDHAGLRFAQGSLPLQIAGDPKLPPSEPDTVTPTQTNPVLLQMPNQGQSSGTEQHLLNLLTGVIERVGGDASHVDVVGLVQALQQSLPSPQPAPAQNDLLGQAERMMLFFGKMQEFMASMQPPAQSSGFGGSGIENLLLQKLLNSPQQQAPGPQIPPPPSPHHVFHPQHGWVLPQQMPAQKPPAAANPQQPRTHAAEAETDDDDDDDDDVTLTPDDLVEALENMSEEEQRQFIQKASAAWEKQMANGRPPSGGLDLSDSYPIAPEGN